jgi:hypothetical protein
MSGNDEFDGIPDEFEGLNLNVIPDLNVTTTTRTTQATTCSTTSITNLNNRDRSRAYVDLNLDIDLDHDLIHVAPLNTPSRMTMSLRNLFLSMLSVMRLIVFPMLHPNPFVYLAFLVLSLVSPCSTIIIAHTLI